MGHANPTAARGGTAAYINANRRLVGQTDLLANMTAIARLAVASKRELRTGNANRREVGTKANNAHPAVIVVRLETMTLGTAERGVDTILTVVRSLMRQVAPTELSFLGKEARVGCQGARDI